MYTFQAFCIAGLILFWPKTYQDMTPTLFMYLSIWTIYIYIYIYIL